MAAPVIWIVQNLRTGEIREVPAETAYEACVVKCGWVMSDCAVNRA